MIDKNNFPKFKKKILINGPVLLLVGPIGTFFSRLSNYFEENKIETFKISFPLFEYGFPNSKRIFYDKEIKFFKKFLKEIIRKNKIKHIFMYGNVLEPHKQALILSDEFEKEGLNINTYIFELGYLRPNFVTLEEKGVNYKSSFIHNREFYDSKSKYKKLPIPRKHGLRIRKIWKAITFITHCFTDYKLVKFEHKLQPKPIYLFFQIKGFFLKYFYKFQEYQKKKKCLSKKPFFIVILQVSTDSQVTQGSKIGNNFAFITKVIKDFSSSKLKNTNLVFKHHPRDRGYNNYKKFILKVSRKYNVASNIFYIHDFPLSKIFRNNLCKGTVLINSSVGYQSLYHSIPVKSFGYVPYNFEGLTDQNNLISFFKKPQKVNKNLFDKFYKYILENSQINGNFDGFFPFSSVFSFEKY
tara:strand:- start:4382 stop:5614 length:1233 start_codon:yes stop_codon:yes gene_type:complete